MFTFSTRLGANAPGLPALPPPAPLPSLLTAFSRRAVIFGAAASPEALAGSAARTLAPLADARLSAIVAEMTAAAEAGEAAYDQFDHYEDPAPYTAACDRFHRAMRRLCTTPATGLGGIAIKAWALSGPWVADCAETAAEIAASLAADVLRLEGARA